jgi:hypothetical protein
LRCLRLRLDHTLSLNCLESTSLDRSGGCFAISTMRIREIKYIFVIHVRFIIFLTLILSPPRTPWVQGEMIPAAKRRPASRVAVLQPQFAAQILAQCLSTLSFFRRRATDGPESLVPARLFERKRLERLAPAKLFRGCGPTLMRFETAQAFCRCLFQNRK